MTDKEFRRLSDFLTKKGVKVYSCEGSGDLEEFEASGDAVLWTSSYGKDIMSGDCTTVVLVRAIDKGKPSERIISSAKKYGHELINRKQAEEYEQNSTPQSDFTINDMMNSEQVPESEWPEGTHSIIKMMKDMGENPRVIRKENGDISVVSEPHFESR